MPLPAAPESRERLHVRRIRYEGWRRDDGLFDIDAYLTDVKDQDYELLSGVRPAGEPVHDMAVRVTIDRAFNITRSSPSATASPTPTAAS